jgi:hypothetical protein
MKKTPFDLYESTVDDDLYEVYGRRDLKLPTPDDGGFDYDRCEFTRNGREPWLEQTVPPGEFKKTQFQLEKEAKAKSKKLVKCSQCQKELNQLHYTTNQWTKPAPTCIPCTPLKDSFRDLRGTGSKIETGTKIPEDYMRGTSREAEAGDKMPEEYAYIAEKLEKTSLEENKK